MKNPERLRENLSLADPKTREFIISVAEQRIHTLVPAEEYKNLYLLAFYCLTNLSYAQLIKRVGLRTEERVPARLNSILRMLWSLHPSYANKPYQLELARKKPKNSRPRPGTDLGLVWDSHLRGLSFDEIVAQTHLSAREVGFCIINIRKYYDKPHFMGGELLSEEKRTLWEELDDIFESSTDKDNLAWGMGQVSNKYLERDRKLRTNRRLYSIKSLALEVGYPYAGYRSKEIAILLRQADIFVGTYFCKKEKKGIVFNRGYYVPLSFKERAIQVLTNALRGSTQKA